MQTGMAPPQGLQLSSLRSIRKVSTPPLARVSAAQAPDGPPEAEQGSIGTVRDHLCSGLLERQLHSPPMTATRRGRSRASPSRMTCAKKQSIRREEKRRVWGGHRPDPMLPGRNFAQSASKRVEKRVSTELVQPEAVNPPSRSEIVSIQGNET